MDWTAVRFSSVASFFSVHATGLLNITGGEHKDKEMVIAVAQVDGRLSIWFLHYNASGHLPLEQVSPKHPNAVCNNGLLVVIEGDHFGKFVCCIHH
jgi:hypothetical protein